MSSRRPKKKASNEWKHGRKKGTILTHPQSHKEILTCVSGQLIDQADKN